jgi:catechol 2,3-dioxygenase-like lactoylglutathione lyase family enzyme
MGAKVHVHLHVSDLAKSREFYRAFLGVAPVKDGLDYVKFLPEFAPLNLALTEGRSAAGDGAITWASRSTRPATSSTTWPA